MTHFDLPSQPIPTPREGGSFKLVAKPIADFSFPSAPDSKGRVHIRTEAYLHITWMVDPKTGEETTEPRVMKMYGRAYESFCREISRMRNYGLTYSETEYTVHFTSEGDVEIIKD